MRPLISVIVPVYKVEKYICECIESIINQTYKNLEIILIDDESPDNSGIICDEYAKKDPRLKVIHQKNGGLSDARNSGLKIMTGEFLMFVDSDDYITKDCIEKLYELSIHYNADLVIGGTEKFDDETKKVIWSTYDNSDNISVLDKEAAMKDMFENGCASWARLYRSEIHKDILFPVGEINEDEAIVLHLLEQCHRVIKTNYVIYNYRYRTESITSTRWERKKLDWVNHCKVNLEFVSFKYPDLINAAKLRYRNSVVWALNNMTYNPKKFSDIIPKFRNELKLLSKEISKNDISKKERIVQFLLIYLYHSYSLFLRFIGKTYT